MSQSAVSSKAASTFKFGKGKSSREYRTVLQADLAASKDTYMSANEPLLRIPARSIDRSSLRPSVPTAEQYPESAVLVAMIGLHATEIKRFDDIEREERIKDKEYAMSQELSVAVAIRRCDEDLRAQLPQEIVTGTNLLVVIAYIIDVAKNLHTILPPVSAEQALRDFMKMSQGALDIEIYNQDFRRALDELTTDHTLIGRLHDSVVAARYLKSLTDPEAEVFRLKLEHNEIESLLHSQSSKAKAGRLNAFTPAKASGGGGSRSLRESTIDDDEDAFDVDMYNYPRDWEEAANLFRLWKKASGKTGKKVKSTQGTEELPLNLANLSIVDKKAIPKKAGKGSAAEDVVCYHCNGSANTLVGGPHVKPACPLRNVDQDQITQAMLALTFVKPSAKGVTKKVGKGGGGKGKGVFVKGEKAHAMIELDADGIPTDDLLQAIKGMSLSLIDDVCKDMQDGTCNLMLLDNGCTKASIIVNPALVSEIVKLENPLNVLTGQGVAQFLYGCNSQLFGTTPASVYNPGTRINILGEAWAQRFHDVEEDTQWPRRWKRVSFRGTGISILFKYRSIGEGGCWIADLSDDINDGVFRRARSLGGSQDSRVIALVAAEVADATAGVEDLLDNAARVDVCEDDEEKDRPVADRTVLAVGSPLPPAEPPPLSVKQRANIGLVRQAERNFGYQSMADLAYHARTGSIVGIPFSAADVHRAVEEGQNAIVLRGKHQFQRVPSHGYADELESRELLLEADLMFVDEHVFLVVITIPGNFSLVSYLGYGRGARAASNFEKPLSAFFTKLSSHRWTVRKLTVDGEKGIIAVREYIERHGILFLPQPKGTHLPNVDNRIKIIKQRCRCYWKAVQFKMPPFLVPWLISTANKGVNISCCRANEARVPPQVFITNIRPDFVRDLRATFGDYVESHEHHGVLHNRVDKGRAYACMHLASAPESGVHFLLNLETMRVIRRDRFTCMNRPLPSEWVAKLSEMAISKTLSIESLGPEEPALQSVDQIRPSNIEAVDDLDPQPVVGVGVVAPEPLSEVVEEVIPEVIEDVTHDEVLPVADFEVPSRDEASVPRSAPIPVRVSTRDRTRNKQIYTEDFVYAAGVACGNFDLALAIVMSPTVAFREYGDLAIESFMKQITALMNNKTWHPVHRRDLPAGAKPVPSHMFTTPKVNPADGTMSELKSRLVANGNLQDKSLYEKSDTSAPTAKTESIFAVAAIAAAENRKVLFFDVGAAFVKSDMKGDVYVYLDKHVAALISKIDKSYEQYVDSKGRVLVKLDKALYGCVESAKLWYLNIRAFLESVGCTVNPRDICCCNRISASGKQTTIVLHVDDGMATSEDESDLELLAAQLVQYYKDVKIRRGRTGEFLGMLFDFSSDKYCEILMPAYIKGMVEDSGVRKVRKTPCTLDIWVVDPDSPLLSPELQERFYSLTYKGVYLSTRVRGEISLTTSFLATRVGKATEQDWGKLMHLCGYLLGTERLGVRLRGGTDGSISCILYVDASYGVHVDGKSHGGTVVTLGGGPLKARSAKHKIVSKSSTEAEMVELSDGVGALSATQQFMAAQGHTGQGVIREDNMSTMRLAEVGRSASQRTAHIKTRYFFVHMFLENGEMRIEHCPTDLMLADILTKPIVGEKFIYLRDMLLGYTSD